MSCPQKFIDFVEKVLVRETAYTTFPLPRECVQTVRTMCEAKGIEVEEISPIANMATLWTGRRKVILYRSFYDLNNILH